MSETLPDLFAMVPKDVPSNLQFRANLLEMAAEDPQLQRMLIDQCKDDILFFFNVFLFTFDPRPTNPDDRHIPFILWDFQESCVLELKRAIDEGFDEHMDKSRDMGATWMILGVYFYEWLFIPSTPFKCASKNEDLVDKSGDPDCLFAKLDYFLSFLPEWMKPKKIHRAHMVLVNLDNNSTINGESTNADIGRGGRQKSQLLDEFASMENQRKVLSSTADATPCRLFVSTPKGDGDEFARMKKNPKMKHISLHWSKHPHKSRGLYQFKDGKTSGERDLIVHDETYKFPDDYAFIDSGDARFRSPWYDEQCERRTEQEVAQEIDINYNKSGSTFFSSRALSRQKTEHGKAARFRGDITFSMGPDNRVQMKTNPLDAFIPSERGKLFVWELPRPGRLYVVTSDISMGQGASNTTISVGDVETKRKVASFVDPNVMPHEAAHMAKALSRFYGSYHGDSFIMWEANGPGLIFGKELLRIGHVYYYRQRQTEDVREKRSNVPGWHSGGVNKRILLSEYDVALCKEKIINPDIESLDEAFSYVIFEDGSIGPSAIEEESSGARANHGDRVIADALLVFAFREVHFFKPPTAAAPVGSYAWLKHRQKKRAKTQLDNAWR
jgi:hypothetical protein